MSSYKILGVNNDHDTCHICGRQDLRRVVWMAKIDSDGSTGEAMPVGSSCAARLMRCTATKVDRMASEADAAREREEQNKVHQIGEERSVINWIIESVGATGNCSPLTQANGLKSEVEKWVKTQFPNLIINIRKPYF